MSWILLIIGRVFYHEHLFTTAWLGCLAGALAVAALSFSSIGP